jgi:tetratricopeptide (TPR) repeat protein
MPSFARAALWAAALLLMLAATYSGVLWAQRPAPGAESSFTPVASAVAAEPAPTAEKPAQPDASAAPAYQTRRTTPGEEFYRTGNYDKAIAYWTEMAKKGDMESNYRLGREYIFSPSGVVERDFAKAYEYLVAASKLGDPRAMFEVATMFDYAMGRPKDLTQAATWYKYSADYGHAQGQYNFATMIETGDGVAKDEIEAYKYYRLASAQGFFGVPYNAKEQKADKTGSVPLEDLEKRLTKDQIKEGETRLAAFKLRTGPLEI